jgi:enoyl-CoA hydratase/carnithine racemase
MAGKSTKAPKFKEIIYEVKDGVAWITINRPEVRNAFREQTLDELIAAFDQTRYDPTIAVAVVRGAGDKAFSAGGDFYAMKRLNWINAAQWNDRMLSLAMTIRGLQIPVVAMVHGYCMGGGHELALWCDIVYAAGRGLPDRWRNAVSAAYRRRAPRTRNDFWLPHLHREGSR